MKLFWSPPGEISENGCWVIFESYYMYTHASLVGVIWQMLSQWHNDRHLVG